MLREMKQVLALLNETEKNMIYELKSFAFDKTKKAGLISDNCRELLDEINISVMKKEEGNICKWNANLEDMKKKVAEVDLDFIDSCSTIEIHQTVSLSEFSLLWSQYRDLIY